MAGRSDAFYNLSLGHVVLVSVLFASALAFYSANLGRYHTFLPLNGLAYWILVLVLVTTLTAVLQMVVRMIRIGSGRVLSRYKSVGVVLASAPDGAYPPPAPPHAAPVYEPFSPPSARDQDGFGTNPNNSNNMDDYYSARDLNENNWNNNENSYVGARSANEWRSERDAERTTTSVKDGGVDLMYFSSDDEDGGNDVWKFHPESDVIWNVPKQQGCDHDATHYVGNLEQTVCCVGIPDNDSNSPGSLTNDLSAGSSQHTNDDANFPIDSKANVNDAIRVGDFRYRRITIAGNSIWQLINEDRSDIRISRPSCDDRNVNNNNDSAQPRGSVDQRLSPPKGTTAAARRSSAARASAASSAGADGAAARPPSMSGTTGTQRLSTAEDRDRRPSASGGTRSSMDGGIQTVSVYHITVLG